MKKKPTVCKNCYGKGYSTSLHGYTYSADFIGDQTTYSKPSIHVKLCTCSRGKDLGRYFFIREDIINILKEINQ